MTLYHGGVFIVEVVQEKRWPEKIWTVETVGENGVIFGYKEKRRFIPWELMTIEWHSAGLKFNF